MASALQLRQTLLRLFSQVLAKKVFAADLLVHEFAKKNWEARDQALMREVLYGTLRQKIYLESLLKEKISFSKTPTWLLSLFYLSLYQLYFLDRVPDHAVLHESVEIAKKKGGIKLAKLCNAVLRGLQRERQSRKKSREVICAAKQAPQSAKEESKSAAAFGLPLWLWQRWRDQLPWEAVKKRALYFLQKPPLYLRLNQQRLAVSDFQDQLGQLGIAYQATEEAVCFYLSQGLGDRGEFLIKEGWASLQDLSSYQVLGALGLKDHGQVLDFCCGHGGKSSAIAEKNNKVKLTINDINIYKIKELYKNFKRLNLPKPQGFDEGTCVKASFDEVLVDAPCSGLGTLSRHPEIRLFLSEKSLKTLASQQLKILKKAASYVKAAGTLLYVVCSLEAEEGIEVVEAFLAQNKDFSLGCIKYLDPAKALQDGFFAAALIRSA